MAKINVIKPTGSDMLSLLSAFKTENLTYVIFDSEKVGSMGLPIIYISKLTDKLEKVMDDNEWQSVKNSLKGIINGTNFEYVKVNDTMNADEAFYTPLTLPQASFDLIKSRYVVVGSDEGEAKVLEQPVNDVQQPNIVEQPKTEENVMPSVMPVEPTPVTPMPVENNPVAANESVMQVSEAPSITPVMPDINAMSNESYSATPNAEPAVLASPEINNIPESAIQDVPTVNLDANIFMQDKETFLKACENMFDALVSKYQKQLEDLERREQTLKNKELEVETKLNSASEHLANAEAREQVANIAHDNAQKVMDLNNLMPSNPNA
jgi:hypothetical protein